MAKKKTKKKNLDEGMILIAPLLPVGGVHGLGGMRTKEDNFDFKGWPMQFDKDGNKILDEQGNKIEKIDEAKKNYKIVLSDKDIESLNIDKNPDKVIEKILVQASKQGWEVQTY